LSLYVVPAILHLQHWARGWTN